MIKRIQTLPKKAPESPKVADTDSGDDDEEEEPVMKKAPKSSELVKADPEDTGDSDTLRAMCFRINKSLETDKNEEEPILKKGIYRDKKILHVARFDTNYLKKILASSGLGKQTKEAIKQCLKQSR